MPKVTIWIRAEDYAQWQAIENKPNWLHEMLSPVMHMQVDKPFTIKRPKNMAYDTIINYCKHGAAKGLCKFGCK